MWCATGGPLSPLVFVLAADLLQAAINDAFARGLVELPLPRDRAGDFPVVQYADDMILVMQACPEQAARMKTILEDYAIFDWAEDQFSEINSYTH